MLQSYDPIPVPISGFDQSQTDVRAISLRGCYHAGITRARIYWRTALTSRQKGKLDHVT